MGATYTRSQLIRDEALESLHLGLFLRGGDGAAVWLLRVQPGVSPVAGLLKEKSFQNYLQFSFQKSYKVSIFPRTLN